MKKLIALLLIAFPAISYAKSTMYCLNIDDEKLCIGENYFEYKQLGKLPDNLKEEKYNDDKEGRCKERTRGLASYLEYFEGSEDVKNETTIFYHPPTGEIFFIRSVYTTPKNPERLIEYYYNEYNKAHSKKFTKDGTEMDWEQGFIHNHIIIKRLNKGATNVNIWAFNSNEADNADAFLRNCMNK